MGVVGNIRGPEGDPAPGSRAAERWVGLGILSETQNSLYTNQGGITAGRIVLTALPLLAGDVISNIIVGVPTAAVGTDPTSIFAGLYSADAAGTTFTNVATSANMKADARWDTIQWVSVALTSAYTVPTSDIYYAAFLMVGAFGTTQPQLLKGVVPVAGIVAAFPSCTRPLCVSKNTQTTLANITSADLQASPWYFAVN